MIKSTETIRVLQSKLKEGLRGMPQDENLDSKREIQEKLATLDRIEKELLEVKSELKALKRTEQINQPDPVRKTSDLCVNCTQDESGNTYCHCRKDDPLGGYGGYYGY